MTMQLAGPGIPPVGESKIFSWRQPSPGGGPPIAPVSGMKVGKVRIQTTPGRLSIDYSESNRELGRKNMTELAGSIAAEAQQQARKGISRIVQDGYRLREFHRGKAIPELARRKLAAQKYQFQFNMVPLTPPRVSFQPGQLHIDIVY